MTEMLTYYGPAGERVGLTAGDLGRWTAATASLLTEECGLVRGDRAAVLLPPHWQTAAVLLGAWSAGIEVSFRGWATAGLAPAGDPLEVTFVERRRIGSWLDEVPAGTHQFALFANAGEVPDGYRDYAAAVSPHLGAAPPAAGVRGQDTATVDGTTYEAYAAVATDIATSRGIGRGDRVLIDAATQEQPLIWLLAPLTVGASVVVCADLDRVVIGERIAGERITQVL